MDIIQLKREIINTQGEISNTEMKIIQEIVNALNEKNTEKLVDFLELYLDYFGTYSVKKCDKCQNWHLSHLGYYDEGDKWYCFTCWDELNLKAEYVMERMAEEEAEKRSQLDE